MLKPGPKSYRDQWDYESEMEELVRIKEALNMSDNDVIKSYRLNDSPQTIRNKLRLLYAPSPEQFKEIKRIVMAEKARQLKILQS